MGLSWRQGALTFQRQRYCFSGKTQVCWFLNDIESRPYMFWVAWSDFSSKKTRSMPETVQW